MLPVLCTGSMTEKKLGRKPDLERRRERQNAFLAAFEETGILKTAAEKSGVIAQQHHRWLKEDQGYADLFNEAKTRTVELAAQSRKKPGPKGGPRQTRRHLERTADKQDRFLEAVERLGTARSAIAETGISMHYEWMKVFPDYATRYAAAYEKSADSRNRMISENRSRAAKASWDDEERRVEWAQQQRDSWTPERRAEASTRMKEIAADPEVRKKRKDAANTRWANPE